MHLRVQTLGVTREERSAADVAKLEVEHDNTLETDTATSVRRSTEPEGIDVTLHRLGSDTGNLHALDEVVGVVDTLSAREDLLSAHEEVVRVGVFLKSAVTVLNTYGVLGIGHGVERTDSKRELVQDEVVGLVLFADQTTEELLILGTDVSLFISGTYDMSSIGSMGLPALSLAPASLSSSIPSAKVKRRVFSRKRNSSQGCCLRTASISGLNFSFKPLKMLTRTESMRSRTSW